MKFKVNDKVIVITGKDKNKTGKITKVISKTGKVVISGINIRTKHIKKTQSGPGTIIKFEAPINASNIMILDPKENKPSRVGYRIKDGKKERYSKLSDTILSNVEHEEPTIKEKKEGKKQSKPKKNKITTIKA